MKVRLTEEKIATMCAAAKVLGYATAGEADELAFLAIAALRERQALDSALEDMAHAHQ